MAGKNGGSGKGSWIQVKLNRNQWSGFTDKELQDLLGSHMSGKKNKKQGKTRAKSKKPEAHIYVGLGKNPMSFSITICPRYPCSA